MDSPASVPICRGWESPHLEGATQVKKGKTPLLLLFRLISNAHLSLCAHPKALRPRDQHRKLFLPICLSIHNSNPADFNLVICVISNTNLRVHLETQQGFKPAQQVLTRLCSISRQNRTAFPTSRKFWKQTVFSSAYSTMSFSWWWKNSKIPEINREANKEKKRKIKLRSQKEI